MDIKSVSDKHREEYCKFDRVQEKLSTRPDLHAFLLLDKLVPGNSDMVSSASHDEICLDVEPSELAAVATEEQIIDLIRCGVRYDSHFDCLVMFV